MSDKIQSISVIDLVAVTGGYSPEVQSFISCHNDAVEKFNAAESRYKSNTPWYDRTAQAEDNFGTTFKEDLMGCIERSPSVRRRPSGGF